MDKIEEVKKILHRVNAHSETDGIDNKEFEDYAEEICQLFEPKPSGRLLTDKEIYKAQYGYGNDKHFPVEVSDEAYAPFRLVAKAQDAKTASIKDAECREMLIRAKKAGEDDATFKFEARIEALIKQKDAEKAKFIHHLLELKEKGCQARIVAAIGLAVSHIWQFAEGTGYPLMWRISDADKRSVLKHYGVHYQGENCPTCEGKCKATQRGDGR